MYFVYLKLKKTEGELLETFEIMFHNLSSLFLSVEIGIVNAIMTHRNIPN